jgi:trimethylamine--corrinoid protein Co-methyltransferase
MDNAMVCSAAQLVIGNEAIGWTKRFIRGIEVNPETIAREVIEAVGPGGHFLQQSHTVKHLRKELWRSKLLTRQSYDAWEKSGSKDISQRIQEKLKDIIETHTVPSLPDKTLAALDRIKQKAEKALAVRQS